MKRIISKEHAFKHKRELTVCASVKVFCRKTTSFYIFTLFNAEIIDTKILNAKSEAKGP